MNDMDAVVAQVKLINQRLVEAGWTPANSVGELATVDRRLWFSSTYVTGEYTLHASHREKGFGVPRGNIRVRVTPALVEHHPELGESLARELVAAGDAVRIMGFGSMNWPPPAWAELSVQGVVDLR